MKRSNKLLLSGLLVVILVGCTKKEFKIQEVTDNVAVVNEPMQALIGKWKLVDFSVQLYNQFDCEFVGSNTYSAETMGYDIQIGIEESGLINYTDSGTLVSSWVMTSKEDFGDVVDCKLNSEIPLLRFKRLQSNELVSDCEIGDTLIIRNPFVNLNFQIGQVKNYSWDQRYVKIE